jgi:hypothetical protein
MKRTSSSPVRTRLMDIQDFEERKYLKNCIASKNLIIWN